MNMGKYCEASSLSSDAFGHIADIISFFTIEWRSGYFYFQFPDEDPATQRDEMIPPICWDSNSGLPA